MAYLVMRRNILELTDALRERQRIEKQMQKSIRRFQRGAGTRSRLLVDLNRDMQAAASSIAAAADALAAGGSLARRKKQADHLRSLARTLAARCSEVLRVSRIEASDGSPLAT
jgi:hypothetical protein